MLKVSAKLLFTLCLLLLMTAALSPTAGAASTAQETQPTNTPPTTTIKIPTGSYMLSCNTCQFEGTSYSCKCKVYNNLDSSEPSWPTTKIVLSTCTVDSSGFYNLTNSYGNLICTTS
jgi:hypothetical protein